MSRSLLIMAIGLVVAPALADPKILPVKGVRYATYDATVIVGEHEETVFLPWDALRHLRQIVFELQRRGPTPDGPMYIDNLTVTELD